MKKGLLDKAICLLTSITLLLNSFSPFIAVSLAQEATATPVPTQEPTPVEATPTEIIPTEAIPTETIPSEVTPTQAVSLEGVSINGVNGGQGAIWTTTGSCGNPQDVNHYAIGDHVFINGNNFDPSTAYDWNIAGQPGGASCDPHIVVASGNYTTNPDGSFCFDAYTIAADDCGEYTVDFDKKNDNYQVDGLTPTPTTPAITGTPTPVIETPTPTETLTPTPTEEITPTPSVCEPGSTWAGNVESSDQGTRKDGSAVLATRSNPDSALGASDGMSGGSAVEGNFFSLGQEGTLTLSFAYPVLHVDSGLDLSFHEVTNGRAGYPEENAQIEVSDDGSRWFNLGDVSSKDVDGISYKDFTVDSFSIPTTLTWVKYVRITDTTNFSPHSNDADGYDLDAVDAANGTCEGNQDPGVCENLTGAIWTTNVQCETVNGNIFESKLDVYLNGGPHGNGGSGLPDGNYYVRVTDPSGADILGESNPQTVEVVDGEFETCLNLYQLTNYSDTTNPAGEYKVWISSDANFPERCSKTDNFKVRSSITPTVTLTPTPVTGKLFISKFNDQWPIDQDPGADINYTITLTASESAVMNIRVTDLPPGGFAYKDGSYKVYRNGVDLTSSVPQPTYHSPGQWDLSSVPAIGPEDKIELKYIATISNSQELGLYKDLAWAVGEVAVTDSDIPAQTLAESLDSGKVDPGVITDNFVGTKINLLAENQSSASINVVTENKTTQNGEVLGASTGLPSTGANTIWVIIASLLTTFGLLLVGLGIMIRKDWFAKMFKFFGATLTVLIVGLFIFSGDALAFDNLSIRLSEPSSPTSTNTFKINFVVLDLSGESRDITVKCLKKGPADADFVQFGSDILVAAGGNTGYCNVDPSVVPDDKLYRFQATAIAGGDTATSTDNISVGYSSSGPGTPTEYSKEKVSSCKYKINFKTADDSNKTVKVKLYRSENTSFNIDSGTQVGSVDIGSNQNGSMENDISDCNKTYYFAIRAYDVVGNGSGVIGDSVIQTTTTTTTTTTTSTGTATSGQAVAPTSGGAIPVANVTLPTEGGEEVLGEATKSAETGEVLGESTSKEEVINANEKAKKNNIKYLIGGLLSVIILVSLIYALKKKKNKEELTIPPTTNI